MEHWDDEKEPWKRRTDDEKEESEEIKRRFGKK